MNHQHVVQTKRVLAQRKQQAETAAIARRETLQKNAPELVQLENKQSGAGAAAAAAAASGNTQLATQKMQQVAAFTQQKKELYQKLGIKKNYLQVQYTCPLCKDTGRVGGKTCACFYEEVRRIRRAEVNETGPLGLCRFESFSLNYYPEKVEEGPSPRAAMANVLSDCQHYASQFGPKSGSLFMYGDAGLGKTHLALSVASVVLDKGFDVIYVSAQSAFSEISASRFEKGKTLFSSMLQADLLILDDIGTEFVDAYVLSKLYELVNGRMRKPTIYTTNIGRQDLLNQRYTEKIASRLMGECHLMRFFGKDIRLLKN